MSNSRWYSFKIWLCNLVAAALPEGVKRAVFYILWGRAIETRKRRLPEHQVMDVDGWGISADEIYNEIRD